MADDIDWSALDYSDPCGLLAILQPKYMALVAGDAAAEIEIDGRRLKLMPASLPRFEKVINQLKADCAALTTGRRARRAASSRHLR